MGYLGPVLPNFHVLQLVEGPVKVQTDRIFSE
jgi:hypothetical protein